MPLMTAFHHLQLNSPVLVEVGQLIPYTFANVSKIHDPSSLQVQKIGPYGPKLFWHLGWEHTT